MYQISLVSVFSGSDFNVISLSLRLVTLYALDDFYFADGSQSENFQEKKILASFVKAAAALGINNNNIVVRLSQKEITTRFTTSHN